MKELQHGKIGTGLAGTRGSGQGVQEAGARGGELQPCRVAAYSSCAQHPCRQQHGQPAAGRRPVPASASRLRAAACHRCSIQLPPPAWWQHGGHTCASTTATPPMPRSLPRYAAGPTAHPDCAAPLLRLAQIVAARARDQLPLRGPRALQGNLHRCRERAAPEDRRVGRGARVCVCVCVCVGGEGRSCTPPPHPPPPPQNTHTHTHTEDACRAAPAPPAPRSAR